MSIVKSRGGEPKLLVRFRKGCNAFQQIPFPSLIRINTFNLVLRIECGRANNSVFVVCICTFFGVFGHISSYIGSTLTCIKPGLFSHFSKKWYFKIRVCFQRADKMRKIRCDTNIYYFITYAIFMLLHFSNYIVFYNLWTGNGAIKSCFIIALH